MMNRCRAGCLLIIAIWMVGCGPILGDGGAHKSGEQDSIGPQAVIGDDGARPAASTDQPTDVIENADLLDEATAIAPVVFAGSYLTCGLIEELSLLGCQLDGDVSLSDTLFSASFVSLQGTPTELVAVSPTVVMANDSAAAGYYEAFFTYDEPVLEAATLVLELEGMEATERYEIRASEVLRSQDTMVAEVSGEALGAAVQKARQKKNEQAREDLRMAEKSARAELVAKRARRTVTEPLKD